MAAPLEFPSLARPDRPAPRFRFRHRAEIPLKILMVDDDPSICRLVEAILQGTGCLTTATSNPDEALVLTRQGSFDVLLADFRMPTMTGTMLADHARSIRPNLKVLYLTGLPALLFEGRITLAADEAYLAKPFTAVGLLEAISLLLCGRLPAPKRYFAGSM